MAKLYIIDGPMKSRSFHLKDNIVYVGRASDNDVQLKDDSISRKHLKITRKKNKYYLEDLKSRNGTWINGYQIRSGDFFEIDEGVPIAIGNVFISLGQSNTRQDTFLQYSISLSKHIGKGGQNLLYKDKRITNRKNLEMIYEVSTLLMQSLDINGICEKIMECLFDYFKKIDSGTILFVNNEGEFEKIISRTRNNKKNIKMDYSRTIVERVIKERKAIMISNALEENRDDFSESMERMKIKSIMCVPLISKSTILGVIYVHSVKEPQGFRKDDLSLLVGLSCPAAVAIENSSLASKSKLTEGALHESEEKYRLLVDNANDAIFIIQDDIIKFANPFASVLSGFPEEALVGSPFSRLFPLEEKNLIFKRQRRLLKGEKITGPQSFRALDGSGNKLHVQVNSVLISWEEKPAILNFMRDITRQKELEVQLLQAQKMESLSTLAGGIAHDFNNLFMGIQGTASLILSATDYADKKYEKLKNIECYVERGSKLTEKLLGFARGGKYEVKTTDLNHLISKSSKSFNSGKKNLKIHRNLQKDIWKVKVDQGQMEQVLWHLYNNAWQAMSDGGTLCLETEKEILSEDFVKVFNVSPGNYVKIKITDIGVGMDKQTQKKIFEPFFTTRGMGKGRGLGLAAVYGIINNHGGIIQVASVEGEGTTFNIYLPAFDNSVINNELPKKATLKTKKTILVVDDEEMLIDIAGEMLKQLDYEVLTARSGKKAINIYKQNQGMIDLVILDMIMPEMGGGETYDRMKEINPEIKALLSSGYGLNDQISNVLKQGCNGFIKKPFTLMELSQKIKEILE